MNKLTAIVLTRNEQESIGECLESISFADEIIIIDDNSTDETLSIAKAFNAKIYSSNLDSFAKRRNLGLAKSSNEWVLFLDADEIISDSLTEEIKEAINSEIGDGFLIKREDIFLGKKMKGGDLKNVWILRLGKKSKGEWKGDVHEKWIIEGEVLTFKNVITHKSHRNINNFISKLDYYSTLRAKELKKENVNSAFLGIILFPISKFIFLFFIKMGFVDGLYGFIHAIFMSFYSYLVRAKLYQIRNEK